MLSIKQPVRRVTVTETATSLWDLMVEEDSTMATTYQGFRLSVNAIEIQAEEGKIRYSINGLPTDTTGMLLNDWYIKNFRWVTPDQVYIICDSTATPWSTYLNVELGRTNSD